MEKILIKLTALSINEDYDVFVPVDLKIESLVKLLSESIKELSNSKYGVSGYENLMLKDPPMLFDPNGMLKDYDIHDGQHLCLL